jgi:hypothetical protein
MITALDYKVDAPRLLVELMIIFQRLNLEDDQILLTHRKDKPSFTVGAGSLKNEYGRGHWARTGEFAYLAKEFENTLAATVIQDVRKIAEDYNKRIGRVRMLRLKSKTCYSLHTDKEEFRFHIPLLTNRSCFFVCGEQLGRMEEVGRLYTFRTDLEHTAVNASFQDRWHLVFDTCA